MSNSKKEELVITRVIDAPRQLVFDAFTKEEHLQHWWGPAGMKLEVVSIDVKPNGKFHYKMIGPDGNAMSGIFNYKEINAPEKIVFTSAFADEKGNAIKAPFDIDFPLEIMNTWTLTEDNGKTTLTLNGYPFMGTEAQVKTFIEMHANMNEGFGKTFDQLISYLAKQ